MPFSLETIAQSLGARLEGDGSIPVTGASEPAMCGAGDLALAMSPKYAEGLARGQARAAILWDGADWQALGLEGAVFVARPRLAMAHLSQLFDAGPQIAAGVHPSAVVDPSAQIGDGAAIGPLTIIGAGVKIGANARIVGQVSIGDGTVIGDDVLIRSGVQICHQVTIGDRVVLNSGSVIGSDGFAFVTPEKSAVEEVRETVGTRGDVVEQSWHRLHSLGTVEIADDVEIGANTTVDRGTIRATRIGRGTKIDNLVQIGHNVIIGEDCLLCGQAGVAGSTRIGDRVVLAGQVGVNDNITIGNDVVAGGGSKIVSNLSDGRVVMGYPAVNMTTHTDMYKASRRLPRLLRDVAALKKAVSLPRQSD